MKGVTGFESRGRMAGLELSMEYIAYRGGGREVERKKEREREKDEKERKRERERESTFLERKHHQIGR